MRVAAKRRPGWALETQVLSLEGRVRQVPVGADWVEVVSVGAGDPLVVVPGMAGGWRLLAPLITRLARRFEVHACGLRGDRGLAATRIRAAEPAEHARDVADVIAGLGLERPAVLGVSFGGAVALELAVEYPQSVSSLTLYGADCRFRPSLGSTIARRALERYPLPANNPFVNQFFNLLHGGRPESADLAAFVVRRCWETDQSVTARRLAALEAFDVSDRLWRVDAPAVVLAGTRDVVVSPLRQRALAAALPGARFETIEGAGHVGFLTHPFEIARQVTRLVHETRHSTC